MTFRAIVTLFSLAFSIYPSALWSKDSPLPLRLWVMTNGPANIETTYSFGEIAAFVEKSRQQGVIIENTIKDLMIPIDTNRKFSLANFVVDNFFVRQLARFVAKENNHEPIAVEFIRWDNIYQRQKEILDAQSPDSLPDVMQFGSTALVHDKPMVEMNNWIDHKQFFHYSPADKNGKTPRINTVPWFIDTRVVYYNKSLIPNASSLSTWESFEKLCKEWPGNNPRLMGFPMAPDWNIIHNMAPWLWAGGGDIITQQIHVLAPYRVVLDQEEAFRGVRFLQRISHMGCASFNDAGVGEIGDMFALEGKYASVITGPWLLKHLGKNWKKRIGIVSLPAGPRGSVPFVGGSRLGIWGHSRKRGNLERAVKLVKFLTASPAQYEFAIETGFPPANKEALRLYSVYLDTPAFEESIRNGRAYPVFSGWNEPIERDSFRDHIWRLWHDIAAGKSEDTLRRTVHSAANDIRSYTYTVAARRYSPAVSLTLLCLLGFWGWRNVRSHRRHLKVASQNESLLRDLRQVDARRAVLEGQILALGRRHKEASQQALMLKTELEAADLRARQLGEQIAGLQQEQDKDIHDRMDPLFIGPDGSVTYRESLVVFDNTRQALRLIGHIVRCAAGGETSVHCLWGYALFDWVPDSIRSDPNRLFNTAVSKLNAPFKKLGCPPLLSSEGKGSHTWRLAWDVRFVMDHSSVGRSLAELKAARTKKDGGNLVEAVETTLAALQDDPLNLHGYILLQGLGWNGPEIPAPLHQQVSMALKTGMGHLNDVILRMEAGLDAIGKMLPVLIAKNPGHEEILNSERIRMEGMLDHFRDIFHYCCQEKQTEKPLQLKVIHNAIRLAHQEAEKLRSKGVPQQVIWSSLVQSENFVRITTSPTVNTILRNTYNHEIREMEDYRLVQLALVWMLEHPETTRILCETKSEADFANTLKSSLKKQLLSLEGELSRLPEYQ